MISVTRQDLMKVGCQQNQAWFDRRLQCDGYKLVDGILWAAYKPESIRAQISHYLKKLEKHMNVQRHDSPAKCADVLKALDKISFTN